MSKRGKKYNEAIGRIDRANYYTLIDAISLLKNMQYVKFDQSLEGHFNIKYKSIQNVRGNIQLPNGTGKTVKILVFAKGEKAEEAENAGADYIGDEELIKKIQNGWFDFHFVVSTPEMMKDVGKLGPILGKKGLMPKPKAGTVTTDISGIVKQLKSGRIEYKADKTGVVHLTLGKLSFEADKLAENTKTAYHTIMKEKPSDAKGEFVTSIALAGSQTPGIKVNIKDLKA